jgi:hypothetical protein
MRNAQASGFTIVEIQVAIVVLAVTILTLGGHHRVMNALLRGVQEDRQVGGYVNLSEERASLTFTDDGTGAGPPPCDIKVTDVNLSGFPRVFVRVQEAPW